MMIEITTLVHFLPIPSSHSMEPISVSTNRQTGKENAVHTHHGKKNEVMTFPGKNRWN